MRTSCVDYEKRLALPEERGFLESTFEISHNLQASIGQHKRRLRDLSQQLVKARVLLQHVHESNISLPIATEDLHSVAGILFVMTERSSFHNQGMFQIILRELLFAFPINVTNRSVLSRQRLPSIVENPDIHTTRLCRLEFPSTKLFEMLARKIYTTLASVFAQVRHTTAQRRACLRQLCAFLTIKLKASTTRKAYVRLTGNENARGPCRTSLLVNALKELGYPGDAVAVGAAIDTNRSGVMTYTKFFRAITLCKFCTRSVVA